MKKDNARQLRLPETLAELEMQLLQSAESLDAGNGVNGEEVIRRLRKRMKDLTVAPVDVDHFKALGVRVVNPLK